MALHYSTKRWQDQLILLLGLWLIVSPFALGYDTTSRIAMNAFLCGAAMALLAAFDLYKTYVWAVALNLLIGVWVAVSPWAAIVADRGAMMTNSVIVGVAVVILGLWELQTDPDLHRKLAGG
jgi:hypothetical protein